jgi:polyhydroxyalkanoate synthesis regulator phasin
MGELDIIGKVILNYGIGAGLAVGILWLCFYLVKNAIKAQNAERDRWINVAENHIQGNTKVMDCLVEKLDEHGKESSLAMKDIINELRQNNQEHGNQTKQHEKICNMCDEISKGLVESITLLKTKRRR